MSRVRALVEGQTEESFVRSVLASSLAVNGVFVTATRIGKPGHRGGIRPWPAVRKDIIATLKQDRDVHCTTMFDYYALPSDWPGLMEARQQNLISAKAEAIERSIHADICWQLGDSFDKKRFVPYIQMHEFEALLFSDTLVLAETVQSPYIHARLDEIVEECGEPEGIDDSPESAPSKRIIELAPRYQKVVLGTIAAIRIGLPSIRSRCPHFSKWINVLEQFGET